MDTTSNNQKTTVLVTGGAGYIGSHMVWSLLSQKIEGTETRKFDVVVLDHFEKGHPYTLSRSHAKKILNQEFSDAEGKNHKMSIFSPFQHHLRASWTPFDSLNPCLFI